MSRLIILNPGRSLLWKLIILNHRLLMQDAILAVNYSMHHPCHKECLSFSFSLSTAIPVVLLEEWGINEQLIFVWGK
jgi:hypothetical protein